MIGILPDNHHLHTVKRAQVEGIEYLASRRVAGRRGIFLPDEVNQLTEIRFLELRPNMLFPALFYLYVHIVCKFRQNS